VPRAEVRKAVPTYFAVRSRGRDDANGVHLAGDPAAYEAVRGGSAYAVLEEVRMARERRERVSHHHMITLKYQK